MKEFIVYTEDSKIIQEVLTEEGINAKGSHNIFIESEGKEIYPNKSFRWNMIRNGAVLHVHLKLKGSM